MREINACIGLYKNKNDKLLKQDLKTAKNEYKLEAWVESVEGGYALGIFGTAEAVRDFCNNYLCFDLEEEA